MPLVPELAIAMLACARIGATHSVIFGGFSAEAIRDRVNDGGCKVIITADGGFRRGKEIELKKAVDEAVQNCPTVENVIVYQRTKSKVEMKDGRRFLVARTDGNMLMQIVRRKNWTANIRFLFSTHPAQPENRKEFCTRPAVI